MSSHQSSKLSKHQESTRFYSYSARNKSSKQSHKQVEVHATEAELEEGCRPRFINDSMIELQDPKFVQNEIDDFQNRLEVAASHRGFCKVSRYQSLLLSNTEGYRKYKQECHLNNSRSKESGNKSIDKNIKDKQQIEGRSSQTQSQMNGNKIQKKQSQVSLTYSNQSEVRIKSQNQNVSKNRKVQLSNKSSLLPDLIANEGEQANN